MNELAGKSAPIEWVEALGAAALYFTRLNKLPGGKAIRPLLLGKAGYDLADYIGERTGVFNLPDSDQLIRSGANAIANLFGLALSDRRGAKEVGAGGDDGSKYLVAAFNGDTEKAQQAVNEVRSQVDGVAENARTLTAWTFFRIWQLRACLALNPSEMHAADLADLSVLERYAQDIGRSVYIAGWTKAADWIDEQRVSEGAYFSAAHLAMSHNPFDKKASTSIQRVLAPLTAAAALKE